jgi:hypothetical protein
VSDGPARRLAEALDRHGLGVPARLLADAHRPLTPLLSDLGAAIGPLAGAAIGRGANDPRELLDDPDGLDRLVEQLDRRAHGGTRAEPR